MRLVLDSSAALRATMSAQARAELGRHDVFAPPLLWSEVYSAMHAAVWRRDLDAAEAKAALGAFASLAVKRRSPTRLHAVAYEIASELGWAKTYDAEFLALARLDHAVVLTTDGRLRRGAAHTGLVVDPTDLR